jgi:hypothetical protein
MFFLIFLSLILLSCDTPGFTKNSLSKRRIEIKIPDIQQILQEAQGRALQAKQAGQTLCGPVTIVIDEHDQEIQATTPSGAISPAEAIIGTTESSGSSGATQPVNRERMVKTKIVTWAGVICVIIAGLTVIVKAWIPTVPLTATLVFAGMGLGFFWLPDLFADNPWLIGVCVAIVVVLFVLAWLDNKKLLNTPVP